MKTFLRHSKFLVIALGLLLTAFVNVNAQTATVTSDKPDYAPRSNAVFTGSGFSPNETVVLKVKNLSRACNTIAPDSSYLAWSVIADASGDFVTNWTVCDCNGDSLRLKATGQTSGLIAYALFKDAAAATYYLKTANAGSASSPGSWSTDPAGIGGVGFTNASSFTNDGDIFNSISGQTGIIFSSSITLGSNGGNASVTLNIVSGSTATINSGVIISLDGKNSNESVMTIGGTIIFGATAKVSLVQNEANATFTLSPGATLKSANTVGLIGTNASIEKTGGSNPTVTLSSSANYEFNGVAQSMTGTPSTVNNLTLSGSGAKTFLSTITTVSGDLSLNGTATSTTTANLAINGNLNVGTGTTYTVTGFSLTVTGTTSVSGTLTFATSNAGTKILTGLVTINSGGVWTNPISEGIQFKGGLTNNGTTFTSGAGTYTFNTNNQSIGGASAISINDITITGITLTNNGTLTVATTLGGTGGLTNSATGLLNISFSGPPTINTLTASAVGNTVNYNHAGTQTVYATSYHNLTLSNTSAKTLQTGTTTIGGNFTLSGTASTTAVIGLSIGGNVSIGSGTTFNASTFIHSISGDWSNSGTFTPGTGTVRFNGAAQTIGGNNPTTFTNLFISGSADKTLTNDITSNSTLTFNNRNIDALTNSKTVYAKADVIRSTTGHVIGNLKKDVGTGTVISASFEIGSGSVYAPALVIFDNVGTGGTLTAKVSGADHADVANSGISSSKSVNHAWTISNSGIVFNNLANRASVQLSWVGIGTDVDAGADDTKFIVGKYNGTWSLPTVANRGTTFIFATGISSFSDFQVGEPACTAPSLSSSVTNVACFNTSTGVINLTATGGSSPYTYAWTGPNSFTAATEDITNLAAGNYSVTVTATGGCTATLNNIAVTQPASVVSVSLTSKTNVLCFGASTGAINITATGGTGAYTYAWTGAGVSATAEDQSGLAAGNYSVIVTDANGCSTASLPVTITQPASAVLVSLTSQANVLCFGASTGAINITATGGTGAYTYAWTGTGVSASAEDQSGLAAGNYSVIVTDANGCSTASLPVTITQPASVVSVSLTSQTNVLCFGASTGAINITATGGTGAYTYAWTGSGVSATAEDQSGLAAGSYSVVVTDANGCSTASLPVTITQPATVVSVSLTSQTNVLCFGASTGSINITATGGTGAYTYAWTGTGVSATAEDQSGLAAGNYSVIVTDANGCSTASLPVTITQPTAALSASIFAQTNVLCYGNSTGSVTVAGANGTPGYEFKLDAGSYQPGGTFGGLAAGSYVVTVKDANGCTTTQNVTITQPTAALSASIFSQTNVLCYGNSTGSVTVAGANGTPGYEFKLDAGTYQPGGTFGGLAAGSYIVTVKDANGCTTTQNVTITQPTAALSASIFAQTNVLCYGNSTGSVTVAGANGTPGYEFKLDAGSYQPGGTFGGLAAGSYVVTIKDANGCTTTQNVTITQPTAALSASIFAQTNVLCYGNSTGSVTVAGANGTPGYEFKLDAGSYQPGGTFGSLAAGSYVVTIKDANGCTTTQNVTITQPTAALSASIFSQTNVLCYGNSTGSVTVAGANGTPGYEFKLDAGTYQPGGTFGGLAAGSYIVTIKDANGCTTTQNVTITQPTAALTASIFAQTNVLCSGNSTGSVTVAGANGTPGYEFKIDAGSYQPGGTFGGLAAGSYIVTIKDANGCTTTQNVTITQPATAVSVALTSQTNVLCRGASTGVINITATGGTGAYTYAWTGTGVSATAEDQSGLAAGNYSVIVTDANGCSTASLPVTITQPASTVSVALTSQTNVLCRGASTGAINITATGGTGAYTYAWAGSGVSASAEDQSGLAAGNYSVIVTDANGCSTASLPVTITQPATAVSVALTSQTNVLCFGASTGAIDITATGGTGAYTYAWTGTGVNATAEDQSGLAAGNYSVIVTDANGCSTASLPVTITQPTAALSLGVSSKTDAVCYGTSTGSVTAGTVSNSVGTVSYSWKNASDVVVGTSATVNNLPAGTYTLTVTDNCSNQSNFVTVGQPAEVLPPTGTATQSFVGPSTVANLTTTSGTNIKWYAAASGGTVLLSTTTLITGNHYYASQTVGGCESISRLDVKVVLTEQTITSINKGVFCSGENMVINFQTTGTYQAGNVFNAELSNGGGNFPGGSPEYLTVVTPASITGSNTVDGIVYTYYTITVKIPVIHNSADHYAIRIDATKTQPNGLLLLGNPYLYDNLGFVINPSPDNFTVTGGGAYCTGGTGVAIGLNDSQTGVNYLLYYYTSATDSSLISTVAGTNSAISFGLQTTTGLYKVKAVFTDGTGCGIMMTGSATVSLDAGPVVADKPDQAQCNTSTFTMTQTAPVVGSGVWTLQSGTATITTPSSPTTTVTGLVAGTSATVRWTVTNGTCSAYDEVIIRNDVQPVVSDQPDQAQCNTSTFTMTQTAPSAGSGVWTLQSGTATITTPSSPTTTVTGVGAGTTVRVRWTVTNGTCSAFDEVILRNDAVPVVSDQPDLSKCNTSTFVMTQSNPAGLSGLWTLQSGSATISIPSVPITLVTNLAAGTSATLRFTVTDGTCSAYDEVIIRNDIQPVVSDQPDQAQCNTSTFTMTQTAPSVGSGVWTLQSGTATITTPSSPTTTVTGVAAGTTVRVKWTVTNGTCSAFDEVILRNDAVPVVSDQPDLSKCNTSTFVMTQSNPAGLSGLWTLQSGSATISIPSVPITLVTNLAAGTSATLRFTVTNGTCSAYDEVIIRNDIQPVVANKPDQAQCNTSTFTMAQDAASPGSGVWTLQSGTATITTPSSPTTTVTGLVAGTSATLRWTVTNGTCSAYDEVVIRNDAQPVANGGPDQTLCNTSTFTMAAVPSPVAGPGAWFFVGAHGTAVITSPGSATTTVTSVPVNMNITLRWFQSNGTCSDEDLVIIRNDEMPVVANKPDQAQCNTSTFTMVQDAASAGAGVWTLQSGTATITTPSSPTTTVTGLVAGTSATLRWTVTNGTCNAYDEVIIRNDIQPVVANKPDQAQCNTSTFTMVQDGASPGTGVWSFVGGYGSAVITTPSSPTTTITGVTAGTSVTLKWTVTNGTCSAYDEVILRNDIQPIVSDQPGQAQCNTSTFTMTQSAASPGSGVWSFVGAYGSAVITTPSSPTTTVTGVTTGTSVTVKWTVTNGTCSAYDEVILRNDVLPIVSDQPDQAQCNTSTFTMTQSAASAGTGAWSFVGGYGSAVITTPSSPTTTVTGVTAGTSVTVKWTVTNGTCSAYDQVILRNDVQPIVSDQPDQVQCNTSTFTMTQSAASPGSGVWSFVGAYGSAVITTPASPTTTVTGVTAGTSVTVKWTVTNGTCSAYDEVILRNDVLPIVSNQPNQAQCNTSTFTMTQTSPLVGTGAWSFVGAYGSAVITDASSPTTTVTNVTAGTTVTVRWIVTHGSCSPYDDVILTNDALATTAYAGLDQVQYNNGNFTLAGNAPIIGTGKWTVTSGTAIITNAYVRNSTVTGVPLGTIAVLRWTITNGTCSNYDEVLLVNTSAAVTVTPSTRQYSDLVTFEATLTPASIPGLTAPTNVDFYVGTQKVGSATLSVISGDLKATLADVALVEPVPFGTAPTGQMAPGAHTVTADFTNEGAGFQVFNPTTTLTITQEDARATFTGTQLVATQNSTSGLATVTLRATIQDISATPDAAGDNANGDIRNAKVRFLNNNVPIVITGVTDASGWVLSGITLVNPADIKTGIVYANWPVDIGTSATDVEYTIGIEVAGYYTRNTTQDNTVITVYKPVGDFITGGGYVIPTQTAGTYAPTPGLRTNFGFNVKYNKSGKSLQGNMNFIFRRTVGGVVRVYQIKSNAMTSLGVDISNPAALKAVFVSKANLTDITNPLAVTSLGGNLSLQVNMIDRGEPGVNDSIAISLYDGSTLLYSSKWTGSMTGLIGLSGGNLVVHSGFSLGTTSTSVITRVAATDTSEIVSAKTKLNAVDQTSGVIERKLSMAEALAVKVMPNPSVNHFTLVITGGTRETISIRVLDAAGRAIEARNNVDGSSIQLGNSYRPGVYIVEVIQGKFKKQLRLIKL